MIRTGTGLLFGTAVAALHELRLRRPDAGCGCFGELSATPVNWRVIARAALLCLAALVSIGAPPLAMPGSAGQAGLLLGAAAAEVALLTVLSPEVGQALLRLGHADPCELREVPVARTLSALRASAPWRRYRRIVADAPVDVWREGCWRFMVFPGVLRRPPRRGGVRRLTGRPPRPGPRRPPRRRARPRRRPAGPDRTPATAI